MGLADKNANGIPDIVEGGSGKSETTTLIAQEEKVFFNGKEYNSLDELPPEAQAMLRKAIEDKKPADTLEIRKK